MQVSTSRADIEARSQREKEAWNKTDIIAAQSFKRRLLAAFDNPHGRKLEEQRDRMIRERCRGATVLDYGCFEGGESRKYLEYGAARVCGIDISDAAISRAKALYNDPRADFRVADAHFLPFESSSFDLIVGRAILHHLDLKTAYSEIARVLKPGGLATFVEPLRGNPLAKLVRVLTPKARTPDELPLDFRDITLGNELIGRGDHGYSGFVSAPVGAVVSVCGGSRESWVMSVASVADDLVSKTPFKYWGRIVYLNFEKRG